MKQNLRSHPMTMRPRQREEGGAPRTKQRAMSWRGGYRHWYVKWDTNKGI